MNFPAWLELFGGTIVFWRQVLKALYLRFAVKNP